MQKVRIPEQILSNSPSNPDIRLVTSPETAVDGLMESRKKERLVRVVIEVDGEPLDLWVNLSRGGTVGSTSVPLTAFFDRYEAQTMIRNEDGTRSGDSDLSLRLANQAFAAALDVADMDTVVSLEAFSSDPDTESKEQDQPSSAMSDLAM